MNAYNQNQNNEQKTEMYPFADRAYSSNSLLTINAVIKHIISINQDGSMKISHAKDTFFLSFRRGMNQQGSSNRVYDKNSELKMSLNAIQVRALHYAMKSLARHGQSDYNKETNGCNLWLGIKDDTYFINVGSKTENNNKIGVAFDKFDFLSFADSLEILCKELEIELFKHQRGIKKKNSEQYNRQ